jgi:hypothetical protein
MMATLKALSKVQQTTHSYFTSTHSYFFFDFWNGFFFRSLGVGGVPKTLLKRILPYRGSNPTLSVGLSTNNGKILYKT